MRPLYALVASLGLVLLAAPVSAAPAADASDCMGAACDAINRVCQRVGGANCVGEVAAVEAQCMGPVCEAINAVCYIALKQWCVG